MVCLLFLLCGEVRTIVGQQTFRRTVAILESSGRITLGTATGSIPMIVEIGLKLNGITVLEKRSIHFGFDFAV